jgi:uncharacterized protein (DUF1015 family)
MDMTLIRPFRALRPVPTRCREVIAPPRDTLTSAEARHRAKGRPWSFLHVSKAEIDLPGGSDPRSRAVNATAAENLRRMIGEGVLIRDANPYCYAYRATWKGGRQTGLACVASLAEYASGRIRRHAASEPEEEADRAGRIEALEAQTGLVTMAYPHAPEVDTLLKRVTERDPDVAVTADDVTHALWVIGDAPVIDDLTRRFDALPAIYIAEGHDDAAAAARVAAARQGGSQRSSEGSSRGEGSHNWLLSVIFPHHEMTILSCNRVVRDLAGRTPDRFLAEVGLRFSVTASASPVRPAAASEFGMFLGGRWYQLRLAGGNVPEKDPVGRLPVALLGRNLIEPILAIADPGSDRRLGLVPAGRGLGELERQVNSGEMAVAFALLPTTMDDVMAVADAGGVMPPRSASFEPKLADGMLSHVLD